MRKIVVFLFFFFITFLNVGAKEEYLKNILVDGGELQGFDSEKTTYDLKYDSKKESVKVTFDYDTSLYKGRGNYGEIKLNYGENKVSFTVTSLTEESNTLTYVLNITREDGRSSDNSLSSLTVAGKKISLTEKTKYDVSVSNTLKTVEMTATLNHNKASFVSGYGERTGSNAITLSGEKTTAEIIVQAENGSKKTYTINIIKSDYKNNDATLSKLEVEGVKFSFKKDTYKYDLNVSNDVEKVKINAVANDTKASLEYDKEVTLKEGANQVVVKVIAEDKTEKEYTLNITRKEKIPLVESISIEGIDFSFDPNVYDYEIETELKELDFKIVLTSKEAKYDILNNKDLEDGSLVEVNIIQGEETRTYNFEIKNKKEEKVEKEENKDTETQNKKEESTFLKKYEMYIGLGVFGLGLLSLLIAILTRPKNSQIM